MGCICGGPIIREKITETDTMTIKPISKIVNLNKDDEINKKLISINQATFVSEKKYNTFLKEYEILEFVGKGAFGTVNKVKHKSTNQIRAMKIINKASFKNYEEESKLLKEIEILKKLNHPNILKLYEFFSDEKNYYMITEFCNGGELFDKIQEYGSFTEKMAASIFKNILMAVAYCHSQNIAHRDLKPENILLEFTSQDRENLSVKIIDYGTSQQFKPNQKLVDKTGTLYYIAPEVLRKKYDEKCDMWSCGVILYILLSGEPPFNGDDDNEIIRNIELGVYDMNTELFKHISEDAKFLIKKLLEYDPVKRYSAVQAMETKWIKETAPNCKLNKEIASNILNRLRTFRADQKLQEATLAFIVNQLISKEETNELKKVFMELDTNNDGKLSFQEIAQGYKKIYGSRKPELDAKNIFDTVDADNNGFISYEEFIRATVDRSKIITDQKLDSAFKLFDKNGDGFICATEIKEVLGRDNPLQDNIWSAIIKEVDINGDGEISLEEFKQMMDKILNNQ